MGWGTPPFRTSARRCSPTPTWSSNCLGWGYLGMSGRPRRTATTCVRAAGPGLDLGTHPAAGDGDRAGVHARSGADRDVGCGDGGCGPGRFVLGLGASSPVIVGNWNGLDFHELYRKSRDLPPDRQAALAPASGSTASSTPSRSSGSSRAGPETAPPVMLAALRPQMLRLAGQEADGDLNWLASYDVARCLPRGDRGPADRRRSRGSSSARPRTPRTRAQPRTGIDLDLFDGAGICRLPRLAGPGRRAAADARGVGCR